VHRDSAEPGPSICASDVLWGWSCPISVDTWKLGRGSLKLTLLQGEESR